MRAGSNGGRDWPGAWNDYVGPLIYLSGTSKCTLSLGLAIFLSQYGSYPAVPMAVTVGRIIPIVILFFITQRTFIQGVRLTGMKRLGSGPRRAA